MSIFNLLIKWKFPLFFAFFLLFLYLHYFENRAYVELEIQVPQKTWVNIYWTAEGKGYSKWRQARVRVSPDEQQYHFYLTDLRKVSRLRIDPHMYKGEVVITKLVISQNGKLPLQFETEEEFKQLQPLFHIASKQWSDDGLHVASSGNDPQLELLVNLNDGPSRVWGLFTRIVAIFSLVILFFLCTAKFRSEKRFIPLFFIAALALIVVMASITQENVHPDEYVHLDAAEYYKSNWLPPVLDDLSVRHTYSVYGISRLNGHEVSYFFNGKFTNILSSFHLSDYLSLRFFNVFLFASILLYMFASAEVRGLAAPLLISPQLWYLFSYCNSDAFAVGVAFLVAWQVVLPKSMLNLFLLRKPYEKIPFFSVLFSGILFGLLFLLKKNYLFFIFFIAGYFLWKVFFEILPEQRKGYCKRVFLIVCIGLCFAGLRIGADYAVNGMDRTAKLAQMQEETADKLYKPSTPLAEKHYFLYRKARGESLTTLVTVDRWFEQSFRSAFGQYGYFTAMASDAYYNAVRATGTALLILLAFTLIFRGGISGSLLFLLFTGCSTALVGASLYHSWTMDFQTQGRYLFPAIPMLSVLLFHSGKLRDGVLYKILFAMMFLLSVYSFIFVGLLQLPKAA